MGVRLDCLFVFHRYGHRLIDFSGSWESARKRARLDDLLVDDLRRCTIRNLVRAGVADKIAMDLSGHKTRSLFDRYNITSERDLRGALARCGQYLGARAQADAREIIKLTG